MSHNTFLKLEIRKPFVYSLILSATIFGANQYLNTKIELIEKESYYQAKISKLETELSDNKLKNELLNQSLALKSNENESLAEEVTKTTITLEKIKETDKELLQKYSKVFFLNEHYTPKDISEIPSIYLTPNSKVLEINSEVLPFLKRMIKASIKDNNPIQIVSAYRSFGTQANLKTAYKSVFGTGANTFSADQGYSEHQLGTTVDLTTPILQSTFTSFENTPAFKWLVDNAHEYGFTLSYPKNNKYYVYEPWHWRFVGVNLATKLHDNNQYFYDLDQREIDEYLLDIFES
jgi:LAS superfamily LD-carboxypeptidase LdcB